ncbi:DUF1441 family protein [Neoaquamicrobium sediminum]|uniref:DUF1441 family protein n=1 Tax=Neoaquamicrobium sediminum TaxID=1849104 RepID=UPI001564A715|nr:DUF1441 family protein [Mesorhizobium sediminum]NRC54113.1 DUF1441 family protein [Mesorhizobium sediminum]
MRRHDDLVGGEEDVEQISLRTADVHSVVGGVSLPWLMKAFRLGRGTAERKLMGCAPIGTGKHGTPLYDLPEAAAYLVKPRVDIEQYIKTIKPDQLPERLREAYWSAKLKSQRWEEKAGHLWRTERVLTVFSEVLQSMRTKLQLIPDRVERAHGLTVEQHQVISAIVDEVQDEIYKELVEFAKSGKTPNQMGEEGDPPERDEDDLI